ncbi:MAG TPA: TIGR03560 family F420-dependent LLM class oxidoreductase [Aggregatilineales bacterium]|nr:TIGR03560 family F420-dependent LLM class oxidoreductase [Aggregatilineales bacterium]
MTQIGIMIEGQDGLNWERWKRILQTAEDGGYQCVFRSDHFTNASPPDIDSLELWTSLTYAASHTQRIEFGSLVTPVTFRHPSITVRNAAAVDDLSGGRLVLGMGAGWQEREHKKFGIPFYDRGTRFEMFRESLEMVTLLLNSDEHVSFKGKHFNLDEALLLPRPQRKGGPPILVGGNGRSRTMSYVAEYACEWNGVYLDHDRYRELTGILNEKLESRGRKPGDVKRSLMTQIVFGETDAVLQRKLDVAGDNAEDLIKRGLIVGTASAVVDQISAWAELGVERFMLQWFELDNIPALEAIAKDVLPHFHQ